MEKRIVTLANLVELNNFDSNDQIDIARFNALEEALAIIEDREPVLKNTSKKKWINFFTKIIRKEAI